MRRARLHAVPGPAFCVVALALVTSCRPTPAQSDHETTAWRPVGHWSGRASTQTDPFLSDTGTLRILWEARPVTGSSGSSGSTGSAGTSASLERGILRIAVHSDVSGRELAVAVDHQGPGRDVAYVNEDPRSFYLVIDAKNLEWSVEVAEGVPATKSVGSQPR
jgi:hypothetical protein